VLLLLRHTANRMKHLQSRCSIGTKGLGPRVTPPVRRHGSTTPIARRPLETGRRLVIRASSTSDEEPDWDKEMSIFTKRTMAPNQLATLREMESKVSLGKVSTHEAMGSLIRREALVCLSKRAQ
jgi:hypothetical protein